MPVNNRIIKDSVDNHQFPYRLLFVYFFLEYGRPQDYVEALGLIKPGLIVTLLLFFMWVAKADKSLLRLQPVVYVLIFIGLAALSILFAVNNFHAYQAAKLLVIFLIGGILPAIWLLSSYERLTGFIKFWMLLHAFVAFMAILNGGKGPGSFLEDENDLALTLNMVLPYFWFMYQSPDTKGTKRLFYLLCACLVIAAIVATASRGGFLGLVAVILGIMIFSKNKIRNFALIGVLCLVGLLVMPDSYKNEIQSIGDSGDSTRNDRLHSWEMGWHMFLDHPVFGVGANNYPWNVHVYEIRSMDLDSAPMRMHGGRAAHSLYFTLMPELGATGTMVYMLLIWGLYRRLSEVVKADDGSQEKVAELVNLALISRAMIVSILTFLITGAFISVLYYPHLWYMVGFVMALSCVAHKLKNKGRSV